MKRTNTEHAQRVLDQRVYFEAGLNLKDKIDLQILNKSGIKANGEMYSLFSIKESIRSEVGYDPGVECNMNTSNPRQLYQIHLVKTLLNVRGYSMEAVHPRFSSLIMGLQMEDFSITICSSVNSSTILKEEK